MTDILQATAARRAIPLAEVRADAEGWRVQWWDDAVEPLEAEVPEDIEAVVAANAAHYAVWGRVGAVDGDGPGFLALHRFAIRDARGSVEQGTETASETWLDVRSRLEQTVDRAVRGRSVPDFRTPDPFGEKNVHRYHVIQARLRNAGKWSRRRAEEVYEEGRHSAEWSKPFRAAEARTYAVPLHFASWWTLLDLKERRTRDGRVKDRGWWWQMLLHALDVNKIADLAGDRNDPTEVLLRLKLRFAASQGLARWLRSLGEESAYWRQVDFGLPQPENTAAAEAVQQALEVLRPVLSEEIDHLDVTTAESKALRGTLIRGENVRTSMQAMTGDNASERQERFLALASEVGLRAGRRLEGGGGGRSTGGGSGGGGQRPHQHANALMARLASGVAPSPDEVMQLRSAVSACEDCRERWMSTVEAPQYLESVKQDLCASRQTPDKRRSWALAGAVAALVAMLFVVTTMSPGPQPDVGLRGVASAPAVHLDLFVVPRQGTEGQRFVQDQDYAVGDALYFQVSADQSADVRVWVEGPVGREAIGQQTVGAERVTLGPDGQATFYRFDESGRYVIRASSAGGSSCEAPSCVTREVVIR